jgi:hypothetical protein
MNDIKARTAKKALKQARALYDDDPTALDWYPYDPSCKPLDEIEIADPAGDTVAVWRDGALTQAAYDLLDALEQQTKAEQAVIDAWETGDVAGAVNTLDGFIPAARAAIARAKGDAS